MVVEDVCVEGPTGVKVRFTEIGISLRIRSSQGETGHASWREECKETNARHSFAVKRNCMVSPCWEEPAAAAHLNGERVMILPGEFHG